MQSLKSLYKNDAILLQFSSVFLSLKIINEVSKKDLTKDDLDKKKSLLKEILEFNENIKQEGQNIQFGKFYEKIQMMIKSYPDLKCLQNFSIDYLENEDANLDALLELKIFPTKFKEELKMYNETKKKGVYKCLIDITEDIISNFLKNTILYQKMFRTYYNVISENQIKDSDKVKEERDSLKAKNKQQNTENENIIKLKNEIIKITNKTISSYQKKEKELNKKIKSLEKEKIQMRQNSRIFFSL